VPPAQYVYYSNTTYGKISRQPRYLAWDQDYINGALQYGQNQSFYIPIDPNTLGDFAIILNKTSLGS